MGFVQADVLALPGELRGRLDLAMDTYGALYWIGDLDRCAGSAASTLRPAVAWSWWTCIPCTTGRPARSAHAGLSYADEGPQYFDHPESYADPEADIRATATVQRAHSLGEVVTAVARAGPRVDRLVKHLSAEVNHRGRAHAAGVRPLASAGGRPGRARPVRLAGEQARRMSGLEAANGARVI